MASQIDEMIERLLNDQKFITTLTNKIYDKLKDEVIIKKLEENTNAIKSLQEAIKALQETDKQLGEEIKNLQEAIKQQGEILKEHGEAIKKQGEEIKNLQEAIKQQGEILKEHGEAIKALQEAVKNQGEAIKENSQLIAKLATEIGSFTSRAGKGLERTIMMVYKEALELHGINPANVKHGSIVDTYGIIQKGRIFEIDFYETDDYIYVFEVKNFADEGALEQILIRKKLIPQLFNKPIKIFLIANYVDKKIKEELEKEGVTIITSMIVE